MVKKKKKKGFYWTGGKKRWHNGKTGRTRSWGDNIPQVVIHKFVPPVSQRKESSGTWDGCLLQRTRPGIPDPPSSGQLQRDTFAILTLGDHYFLKDSSWAKGCLESRERLAEEIWGVTAVFVVGAVAGWECFTRHGKCSSWGVGGSAKTLARFEFASPQSKSRRVLHDKRAQTHRARRQSRKSSRHSVSSR